MFLGLFWDIITNVRDRYSSGNNHVYQNMNNSPEYKSYSWLYLYYPILKVFMTSQLIGPLPLKEYLQQKIYLLKGKVQAGKTTIIIALAKLGLYFNISSIIIVRVTNPDKIQIKTRFKQFATQYNFKLSVILADTKDPERKNQIKRALSGKAKVIICLCNPTQINRVGKIVTSLHLKGQLSQYFLIIDEADSLVCGEAIGNKKIYPGYLKLFNLATKVVFTTGTIYEVIFNEENLLARNIIEIPTDPQYKGINNFIPQFVSDDLSPNNISPEMRDVYQTILSQPVTTQPIIILHKTTVLIEEQKLIQKSLEKLFPRLTSIVYNSKCSRLYSDKLKINNKVPVYQPYAPMGKKNINTILQDLKDKGGVRKFPYIVIIAGDLADRGLSFVSRDYQWHLTHQIYLRAKTSVSNLSQGLRLCGKYNDNIPLTLITTRFIYEQCIKDDKLQDKMYRDAQEEKEGLFLNCLSKQSYYKSEIPESELGRMKRHVKLLK
jgi:hypothetical protein